MKMAELKMLPVSVLKPAAYNPRKKLKKGDKEYKKIEAEAAAEVVRIQADAAAYEIKTKADAEAEANEKIAATVTGELIDYTQAQNWNGKLPSTFIGSGSAIPVIQTDPVGTPAEDEEDSAE